IAWTSPVAIAYGIPLSTTQLNATTPTAGTFTYSPTAGTLLDAGVHTLSVGFAPADAADYFAATATVQLTVNKATPAITWPTPTAISYGTALDASQLNATTPVSGSFAYTPTAG